MVLATRKHPRLRRRTLRAAVALIVLVLSLVAAAGVYVLWADAHPLPLPGPTSGRTADAAGVPTHVEEWPAAHPSGLPPLVLVPGFAESTYVWSRVAPLLAVDRDVVAYDVRGYGFSGRVPPYTLDADTDQLGGVLTALGLVGPRRPVLVGHSLGAAIVLAQALRDPASVAGVVMANGDGTPYGAGPGGVRRVLVDPVASAAVDAVVRHRVVIRSVVGAQCGPGCPTDDAAIDRWRAPFLQAGGTGALLAIVRRPLIGLTYEQEAAVRAPVAVVYSASDRSFDAASAAATAARLRTPAVVGLTGSRHLALLGEPARFAAAVHEALGRMPVTR